MKNKTKYSNELKDMDLCNEMYEEIKNVAPFSKALLVKTVNKTPRVTSRELSSFLDWQHFPGQFFKGVLV